MTFDNLQGDGVPIINMAPEMLSIRPHRARTQCHLEFLVHRANPKRASALSISSFLQDLFLFLDSGALLSFVSACFRSLRNRTRSLLLLKIFSDTHTFIAGWQGALCQYRSYLALAPASLVLYRIRNGLGSITTTHRTASRRSRSPASHIQRRRRLVSRFPQRLARLLQLRPTFPFPVGVLIPLGQDFPSLRLALVSATR